MSNRDEEAVWRAYYGALNGRPPRETLLSVLTLFEAEGRMGGTAVDSIPMMHPLNIKNEIDNQMIERMVLFIRILYQFLLKFD